MLPLPSREDVAATPWEDALTSVSPPTCVSYWSVLVQRAREADEQQNQRAVNVYAFFGTIASFRRVEANGERRLGSAVVAETWRTLGDRDLSDAQLDLLEGLDVRNPEMRARIFDLLWSRRRGHKNAESAVDAYIASAARLEENRGFDLVDRISRAVELGCAIGGGARDRALAHLMGVLERLRTQGQTVDFIAAKLLGIVLELKAGEPSTWAEHAEHYAAASERIPSWMLAREYWQLAAKFHSRGKADAPARAAATRAAETFVQEANTASDKRVSAHFLAGAVEAYRRLGERARAQELHAMMLRLQQQSVADFETISESADISDLAARARTAVRGKTLAEAIFALVHLTLIRRVADLRKEVEENAQRYLHLSLFSTVVVDGRGKVVARRPTLPHGPAREDDNDAITCQMHSDAAFYRRVTAHGTIEPARAEILSEHAPRVQDLAELIENHPFVPPGREVSFAKGLHAGCWATT